RPPTTSRTPMASMYAGPNHLIRLSPPLRSRAMVGAAMFVTVESITSRASASSTSPRIAHIRRLELRVVTVPGSVKVVSGASSSGTHDDTDELTIQLRDGDVV